MTGAPLKVAVLKRGFFAVLPVVFAAAALSAPLAVLIWNGLSPVGMTEESTGYRYFYSLRTLYTADERPWLPQGQVMTVLHVMLQWLLTAAGYPIDQLTPRIELFAYLGAGLAIAGTVVAAFWAFRPLTPVVARVAVVAAMVWAAFDRSLSYGYHLLVPDYHPWIHTVMLVAFGCTLRLLADGVRPSWRWVVALGVFSGLAVSLKVTLVVFVGPPLLLLLLRLPSWRRAALAIAVVAVLSVALFLGFTWLSYGGSVAATMRYFTNLAAFSSTRDPVRELGPLGWYVDRVLWHVSWAARVSAATPLLLVASALAVRPRTLPLVLLPGSLLSLALMWKRDESTTYVEVFDYAVMALATWTIAVGVPALRRMHEEGRLGIFSGLLVAMRGAAASVAILVGLIGIIGAVVAHAVPILLVAFYAANESQVALDRFVTEPPGRVAIVTLDNQHRPLTRDSAIFKGGTNVGESNIWGISPFVQALVPDRHYFFPAPDLAKPIDLSPYTYLLFVSLESRERLAVTEAKLTEAFGMSLLGFDCPLQVQYPSGIQYGCRRRPDAPVAEHRSDIAFVPRPELLRSDAAAARADGPRRPLAVGEAAFSSATGEIWRLESDGSFTRLLGEQGQTITVSSMGEWVKNRHQTDGVPATFEGTRWTVRELPQDPINRNSTLRTQQDGSIRGWDVLTRAGVTVDRRRAEGGPEAPEGWLELQSRSPDARVGVRAGLDRDAFNGGPATALVTVRAFGHGTIWVRFGSAVDGDTVTVEDTVGDDARSIAPTGEWATLVVRLEPDQLAGDRAAIIVELEDPQVGDRLDIGRVEVYSGRFP